MKRALVFGIGIWTCACSTAMQPGDASGDASAHDTPEDVSPEPDDAPPAPTDAPSDAGPTSACEPTSGSTHFADLEIFCAGTAELAVMRDIDAPHLAMLADVQIIGRSTSDCIAIDHAELIDGEGHALDLGGVAAGRRGTSAYGEPLLRAPIPAALLDACGELERFDRFRVHLTGRVDGGTFDVTCGSTDAPSTFWPPETMVTCHSGIDRAPTAFEGTIERTAMTFGGRVAFPHGPGGSVFSAEGDTTELILPFGVGFSDRMAAVSRLGPNLGRSVASEIVTPLGIVASAVETFSVDPLATCPLERRDLVLLGYGGTTERGPYRTEAVFHCTER